MNKMSSNTFRTRRLPTINIENFVKNTKNNSLITNRKRSALKVLTNTVKSVKKCDGNYLKRSLFAKKFDTETKCKSSLHDTAFGRCEEFSHFGCTLQEKDFLPMSMTCNMDMLSDFFNSKNNDKGDFFIDDYNNIMINKIKNTFEKFGEPEHCLPSLPVIDLNFPEILSF